MNGRAISFGPFRLFAEQRLLLEGDKPVRLGGRAFDILAALVERAGQVVGKEELIARAWPQTFVEEANLKIQVSALRRALGDGQAGNRYVVTLIGRGYNFVAPIRIQEPSQTLPPPTVSAAQHNLPLAMTRMVGREQAMTALVSRLSRERLVTIVGPGGVGKTTLALAVAERMTASCQHGVWLVDLAPLSDPRLVPSAVATVLGLEIRTENPLPGLVAALRDRLMLLMLDNCEHVIDAVAGLATAVLSGTTGIKFLATSREPLRVVGEREYRLRPLSIPESSSGLTAADAAKFPAVQLFVERATATVEDFTLTDANTPMVVEICRRLDGLPLAIEFAAPRVEALGVEGLAARLDHSLPLLGTRSRAAMPRHRTMRAVVDWSYGLLSEDEQRFFRTLGIFSAGFTVEAVAAVIADAAKTPIDAMDRLADLVAKSLIVADVGDAKPRFRLLDTTRDYALEKLHENGERERVAHIQAEYYHAVFARAEGEAADRPMSEWLADYAREIDNLRTALDWSFSPSGDGLIGVALTAAAVPLWMRLSLLEECRGRAKQALGVLATGGARDPREEMRLQAALGDSTPETPEMGAAFTKALEIAESIGDTGYQLRAHRGLYLYRAGRGEYRAAMQSAQNFHNLATRWTEPSDRLFGERLLGAAKHLLGDHTGARHHLEQVLTHYAAPDHGRDVIRFGTDLRVAARAFLARVQWLQGFPDQAARNAEMSAVEAQATGHAMSVCYSLALAACPISLWVGNLTAAAHYTGMLVDQSRRHGLVRLSAFVSRFQRVVALKGGDLDTRSWPPRAGPQEIVDPNVSFGVLAGLTEQAEVLGHAGHIGEGLALLEAAIERYETGWLTPELLRLKGELLRLQSTTAAVETIEDLFRQALDESRRQEALSWQLRAATSLARLLRDQDRPADAIAVLQPIYSRFTEGFDTADLITAKQLLHEAADSGNMH